ncbi:MAG: formyl transferase, partial [Methanomicrobiales archaeon]|nr:formyl transferase [Methanomicrobiales archaeon]
MKILLLAHDKVGYNITNYLLNAYPKDLVLVATLQKNEIFSHVEEMGYPVCVFESSEQLASLCSEEVDLGILAWWPNIINKYLLSLPKWGFINTHPSLLPYNRGKHYNFWAIVEEVPFGVTLHRVDLGVDTGDIIVQK